MINRIITGLIALAIGALAIGLPIVLTEAGTSTTGTDRTLNASFEYEDPATGDRYYATVFASISQYSQTTTGGGGNGGAGSGRVKSERPRGSSSERPGGGNSGKPSGGGTTQTWVSSNLDVYIDRFGANGNWLGSGDGYTGSAAITVAADLASGSVRATVPFYIYRPDGSFENTTIAVDLAFTATGALVTTRERYSFNIKSPRQSYRSMTTTSRRIASATGNLEVGSAFTGSGTIDIAANGGYYAEIANYDSTSRSSN